jgi:transposase
VIAYHLLKHGGPYRDLGGDSDRRADRALTRSLVRRLERLGHTVVLDPAAA